MSCLEREVASSSNGEDDNGNGSDEEMWVGVEVGDQMGQV